MRILPSILIASLLSLATACGQTVETFFSFANDGSQGEYPTGAMVVGPGGLLYGTTVEGGAGDNGTAFKITTEGAFTPLGSFNPATTGRSPYSRLITVGDGFLYGVTERNTGISGDPNGTLFKLDPANGLSVVFQLPGSGITPKFPRALLAVEDGAIRVLGSDGSAGFWKVPLDGSTPTSFNLDGNIIGAFAYSATLGSNGLIYGTTRGVSFVGTDPVLRGTLFRVAPDGNNLVKLHDCQQATGTTPNGGMVQATDGNFYGTMSAGGASGYGTIFRLTPDGDYTVIHHFDGLGTPLGDLIQATDGFLYGTAQIGGATNLGGVFRISLNGANYTPLHNFNGNNGSRPTAGLVQAADGHLYGVVAEGGAGGKGAIFRVKLSLPPPNRAPVALDDIGVTTVNTVTINVLGNDFDPEGGALTVTEVSVPSAGTANILVDNTIQYTPGVGFTGTDTFTYTVSDPQGLTATATVTIQANPVSNVVYSGAFNGLLNLDPDLNGSTDTPRAQIFVSINSLGKFTGFMVTQRKRVPFRGTFDLTTGIATAKVNLPRKNKAELFLGFLPNEEATLFAVVFGREVWSGGARPVILSGLATTDRQTLGLVAQGTGMPDAFGFGIVQIKANGLVTCVGKHGDGTRLAWGTTLVSDTDGTPLMPVFSEPVSGGVCAGVLDPRILPADYNFAGNLRWIRPPATKTTVPYAAGFTGGALAGMSRYIPRPKNGTLDMAFSLVGDGIGVAFLDGGPLAAPIAAPWSFAPTRVVVTAPLKQLKFNQQNGLVTGKMMNGNKPVSFIGTVNQPGNFAVGQFQIGGVFGRFELNP